MRWHTEECWQRAYDDGLDHEMLGPECIPECEQKWREFINKAQGIAATRVSEDDDMQWGYVSAVQDVMYELGIEEVNPNT